MRKNQPKPPLENKDAEEIEFITEFKKGNNSDDSSSTYSEEDMQSWESYEKLSR